MITVVIINVEVYVAEGPAGVIKRLRAAGIPVRPGPDGELRLCQVWSSDGKRCLGYGVLTVEVSGYDKRRTFSYTPPEDPHSINGDVIDVEAREIKDQPRLK